MIRKTPLRKLSVKRQQAQTPRQWNSTLPRPTKKIQAKKRTPSEFARIYGSRERVRWVKSQMCIVVSCMGTRPIHEGAIENAHITTDGIGRKADARFIVPLCRGHHRGLHNVGAKGFERVFRLDLANEAAAVEANWQSYLAGQAPQDAQR